MSPLSQVSRERRLWTRRDDEHTTTIPRACQTGLQKSDDHVHGSSIYPVQVFDNDQHYLHEGRSRANDRRLIVFIFRVEKGALQYVENRCEHPEGLISCPGGVPSVEPYP